MSFYFCITIYFCSLFTKELKKKQKEFESKALLFSQLPKETSGSAEEPVFKNSTAPLQRKQSNATKPTKQQAVVQPLQGQRDSKVTLTRSFPHEMLHNWPFLEQKTSFLKHHLCLIY